jgi:hypothetical protein
LVSAEGADGVQLRRAAHAGHFCAERFGYLDREYPYASYRTDDQNLLS